jgi:hypothetical protein
MVGMAAAPYMTVIAVQYTPAAAVVAQENLVTIAKVQILIQQAQAAFQITTDLHNAGT